MFERFSSFGFVAAFCFGFVAAFCFGFVAAFSFVLIWNFVCCHS